MALPPQGWDYPQRFPTLVNQQYPKLAASDKYIYQGFLSGMGGSYELCFRRSTDAGFHWRDEIQISQASSHGAYVPENQFDIATSSDGSLVYLIWTEIAPADTGLWFSYSTDYGATWSPPDRINDDLSLPYDAIDKLYPKINCDNSGFLHLAFYYKHAYNPNQPALCYGKYYQDAQGIWRWSPYEIVDQYVRSSPQFDIAVLGATPHIVYTHWTTTDNQETWHARREPEGWYTHFIFAEGGVDVYRLVTDDANRLHLAMVRLIEGKETRVFYTYSQDQGDSWSPREQVNPYYSTSTCGIAVDGDGIHIVYEWHGAVSWVVYRHKTAPNGSWDEEVVLANLPDTNCVYPDITSSDYGRHVVFYGYPISGATGANAFVRYLANLSGLYSGSEEATAYNSARHLVREPGSENLCVVYQTDFAPNENGDDRRNWIYFASSTDGGDNWSPYQWLNYGRYPALDMLDLFSPSGSMHTVVYLSEDGKKILYRWYDPDNQVWSDPIVVYDNPSNHDLDPPAITAVEDTVFILFAENSADEGRIQCAWFCYDGSGLQIQTVNKSIIRNRHSPSVYHDGNRYLHAVWKEKNPEYYWEIWYAQRIWGYEEWGDHYWVNGLGPPEEDAKDPFIEVWGDYAHVVWTSESELWGTDILRNKRDLKTGDWRYPEYISNSPFVSSEHANASHDFVIWSEELSGSQYDIRRYHDSFGYGWINTSALNSDYSHSAARPDLFGVWLYVIWTEQIIPDYGLYQIYSYKEYFSIGPEAEYYSVGVGDSDPSPFLIKREGIRDYGEYRIDYDPEELIYELSFLDPAYDYYLVTVSYHEGKPREETWFIDDKLMGEFKFMPKRPETVMIKIPLESYLKDRKVRVTFRNVSGPFAAKAGLKLLCADHKKSGSGGQSAGPQTPIGSCLKLAPNPTTDKLTLKFSLTQPCWVTVKLFDPSGRKIATPYNQRCPSGERIVIINLPATLSSGVYFLILEAVGRHIAKKVVLQK